MEKYRSCKYPRRNSVRGMYVSASSCKLRIGQLEIRAWYPVEFLLFMNKYIRSEAKFDAANISHPSINCLHLHLFRHAFYKLNRSCLVWVLCNNSNLKCHTDEDAQTTITSTDKEYTIPKTTAQEIRNIIDKTKNNKAPGIDGKILKNLPPKAIRLTNITASSIFQNTLKIIYDRIKTIIEINLDSEKNTPR